jgi:2-dehydropantoate 2-reductase
MRIAVLGAGAIGGVIAARLARAGHAVTAVARGAHLAAIKANGLCLRDGEAETRVALTAIDDAGDLGHADILFLCVKAHDLASATSKLDPALVESAIVVPVLNGIPWWYRPPGHGRPLRANDPHELLSKRFERAIIVAAVAHFAADVPAAGVVRQTAAGRLILGGLNGSRDAAAMVLGAFKGVGAGLDVVVTDDIAREVWVKLAGNAAFNPVSALTGATMSEICASEALLAIVRKAMTECMETGARCGVAFPVSVEQRVEMARAIGGSKLSMLQDLERGRAVEADAMIGAIAEIGRLKDVPTPTIDMLQALVSERALRTANRRST